jgi:predicted ATPase with chaperone activity
MESGHRPQDDGPGREFLEETGEPSRPPHIFRREGHDAGETAAAIPDSGPEEGEREHSIAQTLSNLAATLEAEPPAPDDSKSSFFPKQPHTLAEAGLSKAFLVDLTLKIMHYSGTPSAAQLMRRTGLSQMLIQQILATLQEERMCEVLSQSDLYTGNYRYRLSERGTARVSEALERTRYAGPAPVTAEQYAEVTRAQQTHRQTPSRDCIRTILDELVLAPEVADAVARALHSGKTTMFYGPSGNGKTTVLERFARNLNGAVLVPYAIYAYGQVIRVFDPSIHKPVEEFDERNAVKDDARLDRRWVLVRRPAVVLGSEIGPESLDLAHDPQANFYQAPPHVKAQGGVVVVDDLGRQRTEPHDLMARWLIPVERGWDSLSLITGEKLTIPFDVQLLFGTNQPIGQLADDALLRRILYKIEIPSPGRTEFADILRRLCSERNVRTQEGTAERVVEWLYGQPSASPRAAYARDLLQVVIEGAAYDGREPVLDEESFQRAFKLFMSQRSADEAA